MAPLQSNMGMIPQAFKHPEMVMKPGFERVLRGI